MTTTLPAPKRVDIRQIRERFGLTQADIADHLHVDVRTVRRWEREPTNPSPMAMAHIRALHRRLSAERERQAGNGDTMTGAAPQPHVAPASLLPGQGHGGGREHEAGLPRRRLPSL